MGKKIERGVDPMECVALGAAIQAAIIKGETKEVKIKNDDFKMLAPQERVEVYKKMEEEMYLSADMLNFELATEIRDKLRGLKKYLTSR